LSKPVPITAKKLLLAEGRDAELFLVWAVRHFRPERDFQVMDFGGITELTDFLKLLVNDESYDDIETIVVARDAETDAKAATISIQRSMTQANMPVPQKPFEYEQISSMKTAFMIFPGPQQKDGTLEDLCLLTVENDPLLECVDGYLECAKDKGEQFSRIHKNKLHCFLAGKNDYAGLPIGLASRERAWDFDHPALEPFKRIIQEM
jgi:hypothetical protein